ncbi:MAG: TIGR03084 family metal-binding protein [Acidimicrobiales bacterium]
MSDLDDVRADLRDEHGALGELLTGLDAAAWHTPTASPGWDVADQVGHLAYFDHAAALAITDPGQFAAHLDALLVGAGEVGVDAFTLGPARAMTPTELLGEWRVHRSALDLVATTLADGRRVPWYGPSMSATSFLGARLMETWAHGTDVAEALGLRYVATSRLRHVARLGFLTRAWSYTVRGDEPPKGTVRVDLTGPNGERWIFGELDAADTVTGPARDFCLVVAQRRHLADTALVAGELGRHWLERAQVFAGAPSDGPPPGGRRGPG